MLVEKLIESFYVDDVVTGAPREEEPFQLYSDSKKLLKDGAFNPRKFRTNSPSLQLRINRVENQVDHLHEPHGVGMVQLLETFLYLQVQS